MPEASNLPRRATSRCLPVTTKVGVVGTTKAGIIGISSTLVSKPAHATTRTEAAGIHGRVGVDGRVAASRLEVAHLATVGALDTTDYFRY